MVRQARFERLRIWRKAKYYFAKHHRGATWWLLSLAGFGFMATNILTIQNPADAPIVGASFTIYAFFSFTILKARENALAHAAETKLADLRFHHIECEVRALRHECEKEASKRNAGDRALRAQIEAVARRRTEGRDAHGRSTPVPPFGDGGALSLEQPILTAAPARIADYGEVRSGLRKLILHHRSFASSLAKMEAIGVLYGAAVSAFGADVVRWWTA